MALQLYLMGYLHTRTFGDEHLYDFAKMHLFLVSGKKI
jgi:hypothetical protein